MRAGATTKTEDPPTLGGRARAFDLALFERAADEVVRGDRVTLFRTPSLPRVPHLHGVVAHGPIEADAGPKRTRARPRARGRKRAAGPLEGTFDHGEEGYGLWLDPAVEDDPVYAEHWAGHRPVEVTIEEDQIVIRRAGGDEDDDD